MSMVGIAANVCGEELQFEIDTEADVKGKGGRHLPQRKRRTSMNTSKPLLCVLTVSALAIVMAACASTSQVTKVTQSGFLKDYSQLKPGEKGEAQLLYIDPAAKFGQYNKIMMDPIKVYATDEKSGLNKVPKEELQSIIDYLDCAVRTQLTGDYTFVKEPGPGTMRLRIAITEAKGANVALNAVSTVVPGGSAINVLQKAVTGAATGVGKAGVEMELLDAQTGKRLAAAVDARAASKMSSFSKWQGVQEAYDYWAGRLRVRLAEFRKR